MPRCRVMSAWLTTLMKDSAFIVNELMPLANTWPLPTVKKKYPSWKQTLFGCGRTPPKLKDNGAETPLVKVTPEVPEPPASCPPALLNVTVSLPVPVTNDDICVALPIAPGSVMVTTAAAELAVMLAAASVVLALMAFLTPVAT